MKIPNVTIQQLLEAGVHLGHRHWNGIQKIKKPKANRSIPDP